MEGIVRNRAHEGVADALIFIVALGDAYSAGPYEKYAAAKTKTDGSFYVDTAPETDSVFWAYHPAYAPSSVTVLPRVANPTKVEITLADGGSVEGLITIDGYALTDNPYGYETRANIEIRNLDSPELGRLHMNSGLESSFERTNVTPGLVEITALLRRQQSGSLYATRSLTQRLQIVEGEIARIDFNFAEGDSGIEGMVFTQGQAYRKTVISAEWRRSDESLERFQTQTDGLGYYRLDGLPLELAAIRVAPAGSSGERLVPIQWVRGVLVPMDIDLRH